MVSIRLTLALACLAVVVSAARNPQYKQSVEHGKPLVRPSRAQRREISHAAVKVLDGEVAAAVPYNEKSTVVIVGEDSAAVDEVEVQMPGAHGFSRSGQIPPGQANKLERAEQVGGANVYSRLLEFKGRSPVHSGRATFRAPADGKKRVVIVKDTNPERLVVEPAQDDFVEGDELSFRCALMSDLDGQPDGVITTGIAYFKHDDDLEALPVDVIPDADGWSIASGVVARAGSYTINFEVSGSTSQGEAVERTATVVASVASGGLDGIAAVSMEEDTESPDIIVTFTMSGSATEGKYMMYAAIHGTNEAGQDAEVAIVSGMADLEGGKLQFFMPREELHGFVGGYRVAEARVECASTHNVLASVQDAAIATGIGALSRKPHPMQKEETAEEHQRRRTMGRRPERPHSRMQTQAAGGKLMLVHGYCSSDVWGPVQGQFSDYIKFQDFDKNRDHDAFAILIANFGASYPSFGVVAHSQGGAATLHLYRYYWSGLDYASSGRLIQSVGTPYQGTALAGNAAVLGQIFGVGCGAQNDLTYSGASAWLSGITSWARAKVRYYTTAFNDRWWAYDYCNLVTDVLLDDPDDGTTEKSKGQLSGAVNGGHKSGWCHTDGMRDTAQARDSSRNSNMNSNAAR